MSGHWPAAAHGFPVEELDGFLLWAAEAGASDIALQTGETARMEIDGRLVTATASALDSAAMGAVARELAGETAETVLRSGQPVDCSHAARTSRREARRFRVNMSPVQVRHATGINISIRILPDHVPTFDELAIEDPIREAWAEDLGPHHRHRGAGVRQVHPAGRRHAVPARERAGEDPGLRGAHRVRVRRRRGRPAP